jgi:hypothetical protein
LARIHDSLVSYMQDYDEVHFDWYQSFRYIADTIYSKGNVNDFANYLDKNSDKFYINNQYMFEYLKNRYGVQIDIVDQALVQCGSAIFYEESYIFNIINFLIYTTYMGNSQIQNF